MSRIDSLENKMLWQINALRCKTISLQNERFAKRTLCKMISLHNDRSAKRLLCKPGPLQNDLPFVVCEPIRLRNDAFAKRIRLQNELACFCIERH